jgi:long-chain acyl-CoA synthetase
VLLYTSGTTGRSKGAALTHTGLRHNTEVTAVRVEQLTADDAVVGCLPLFRIFGQTFTMNAAIHQGATLILIPRFEPQAVLDAIAVHGATVFEGVPTMYVALLQHPSEADLSTMWMCVSGGASLPVEVLHGFERRFGWVVCWGATECPRPARWSPSTTAAGRARRDPSARPSWTSMSAC